MSFEDTDFRQEILDTENPYDVELISDFLAELGFEYEANRVDTTMILYNLNEEMIGTGSMRKRTLKFVAIAPKFRDTTAFALIVSFLTDKILENNRQCFVFTKPKTAVLFESLGFRLIATAEPLFSVLEFGYESIKDYQNYLLEHKQETKTDSVAAIVVNCNPFTNGHKYLIEKAASENEILYLFVVSENLSVFPFELRWELIKKGISHLDNVVMLTTESYIVSGAIFPNYFLKQESWSLISQKQAEIDVKIFLKYIAPILDIKKRYVGTESYCQTTATYNKVMKELLPEEGVKLIEIDRLIGINSKGCISASKIREAIKNNTLDQVLDFLPEVTKEFLLSENSAEIRNKIKNSKARH